MSAAAFQRNIVVWLVHAHPDTSQRAARALTQASPAITVERLESSVALAGQLDQVATGRAKAPGLILLHMDDTSMLSRAADLKQSSHVSGIPVLAILSSAFDSEMESLYAAHVNCCMIEPAEPEQQEEMYRTIGSFWAGVAKLPVAHAELKH